MRFFKTLSISLFSALYGLLQSHPHIYLVPTCIGDTQVVFADSPNVFDSSSNLDSNFQTTGSTEATLPTTGSFTGLLNAQSNPQLLRIEAENMTLENYRLESIDFTSNQTVISFAGGQKRETGSASVNFTGQSGIYDVVVGYFDEEGGGAQIDPLLNGRSLGKFKLDQKLGSRFATPNTFVRRTVGSGIALNLGDKFTLYGAEEANESARIDYVEFILHSQPNPISTETPQTAQPIRINAGGSEYKDKAGRIWMADRFFEDGTTAKATSAISGSPDDPLYQSGRYAKTMDYHIPIANGTYTVNLLFAETLVSSNGDRLFNIALEGKTLTTNFDIYASAGKNQAIQKGFKSIIVTDGVLNLQLNAVQNYAQLSGIEIVATELIAPPIIPEEPSSTPPGASPLNSGANIRFITPNGSGDGTSWQQAAGIANLDRLIEQSAPGDEIWIAGDLGSYNVAGRSISIDSGSQSAKPVYIRGVASKVGGEDTPVFVGNRDPNWSPGKADGGEVFRLLQGANNLNFRNLEFKNVGNGAFRFGGDLTGITLEDMKATNVRRFVENHISGSAKTASVSNLTIRDVEINGFSKGAIRLQYNSNNVLIEDVVGDSQQQDGDEFAMGVQLAGTVNNVVHRRVTMKNAVQRKSASDYWNADGFVTEWGTYNITYEDTFASGNTDGGYDLKSRDTLLIRAGAADNKRNFRIWNSATMIDVASDDPLLRGGIGTAAHIHVLGNDGNLSIQGGTFSGNQGIDNIIFDLDEKGRATVENVTITDNRYTLSTVEQGKLELKNVTERP